MREALRNLSPFGTGQSPSPRKTISYYFVPFHELMIFIYFHTGLPRKDETPKKLHDHFLQSYSLNSLDLVCFSSQVHLNNKQDIRIYEFPIAGQTAGPIRLKFFVDTHAWPGGDKG